MITETVANPNNYGIFEIERHFHSYERWYEAAASPSGETHIADRIGSGSGAFQIDAGNDDWGLWVQVLGSSDTPADTGKVKYVFRDFPLSFQLTILLPI